MFRDGSVDSMVFQRNIQIYKHRWSKHSGGFLQTSISLKRGNPPCLLTQGNDKQSTSSLHTLQSTVKTIIQDQHTQNEVDIKTS